MAALPFFVEPYPITATANVEESATPASHVTEMLFEGMIWRTPSITASNARLTIDLGTAKDIDFVGLLQTNAQSGTQWKVEIASATNKLFGGVGGAPEYTSGTGDLISPATTGRDYYHGFLALGSPQTQRYVGIEITGHTGNFEASFAVIGKRLTSARFYDQGWETGADDLSTFGRARNGVPDVAQGKVMRRLAFTLGWINETEFDAGFAPMLQRIGRTKPILAAFDPEATTRRQARTYFGTMIDQSRFRQAGFNRFEKQFEIQSVI